MKKSRKYHSLYAHEKRLYEYKPGMSNPIHTGVSEANHVPYMSKKLRIILGTGGTALFIILIITIIIFNQNQYKKESDSSMGENQAAEVDVTNDTIINDGKAQKPQGIKEYEKDNQKYRFETYRSFDIEYPVLDQSVVNKEPIGLWNLYSHELLINFKNGVSYLDLIQLDIPAYFEDDSILEAQYTLLNCPGSFGKKNSQKENEISKMKHYVSDSVTVKNEKDAKAYMLIYLDFSLNQSNDSNTSKEPDRVERINAEKDCIAGAIIQVDLKFDDGHKETRYIGLELPGSLNVSTANAFWLSFE